MQHIPHTASCLFNPSFSTSAIFGCDDQYTLASTGREFFFAGIVFDFHLFSFVMQLLLLFGFACLVVVSVVWGPCLFVRVLFRCWRVLFWDWALSVGGRVRELIVSRHVYAWYAVVTS